MKGDAGRSFEVFEFKEEDEVSDVVPTKFLRRLKNAEVEEDDAILKYNYLGFVSNQISQANKVSGDLEFVDVDSVDSDNGDDSDRTYQTTGKVREIGDVMDRVCESEQCKSPVFAQKRIIADRHSQSFPQDEDTPTLGCVETCHPKVQSIHDLPECGVRAEDQVVDATASDSEERMPNSSPADVLSDFAVNSVYSHGCMSDTCSGNQEIPNKGITVQPDIVAVQNNFIWDAEMCFTSSSIQLTGLSTCGGSSAQYEWSIDNIISIEAQWHERVQTTVVLVHVLSEDSSASDPSGILEIKFTLYETDWVNEQEHIMSLNDKYKPLFVWNDSQSWPNQAINGRIYYPEFDGSFDELVFPKDDSDPVTVCKRDVDLLEPEVFINDTIIDFYIKYLKDRLEPEKAHKFHFFNSFFFRKLADLERSQFVASEGRTSFLRVRKWTRKVNLFEKDYIFIPVNSNLHWSLVVICHPGEIAKFEDNNLKSKRKVPCILHMDSIKGSHNGLKNHIQSYLWEEWKEKQNEASEEISLNFFNLRFISLEVPQQENCYDCGLFLLHYVELFLEEAPESLNPFHITKSSKFLNASWFPPGDVSLKRAHIQRIIYDMNCKHNQERNPPDSNNQISCQKFSEPNNNNGTEVELLRVKPNAPESCSRDLLHGTSQEMGRSTLGSPSASNHLFADDSNLELEFHGTAVEDFNLNSSNSQLKSYIASIENNAGNDGHIFFPLTNGAPYTTRSDQVSFQSEDYRTQNLWSAVNSTQAGVELTENLKCSSSCHESDDVMNVEVERDTQMNDIMVDNLEDVESHRMGVGSSNFSETANLAEATCCPSLIELESASIKTPNCSQLINTCIIIDNTINTNPSSDEKQNGETTSEDDQDFDTPEQLDEWRKAKRARVEASDEVSD